MIALILAEVLIFGIVAFLGAYFYSEHSWKRSKETKVKFASKKPLAIENPASYKTDGVVY